MRGEREGVWSGRGRDVSRENNGGGYSERGLMILARVQPPRAAALVEPRNTRTYAEEYEGITRMRHAQSAR